LKLVKNFIILKTIDILDLEARIEGFVQFCNDLKNTENINDGNLIFIYYDLKNSFDNKMTLLTNFIKNIIGISQYTYTIKKHSMMKLFKIYFNIIKIHTPQI
jgi:hypothetical protein